MENPPVIAGGFVISRSLKILICSVGIFLLVWFGVTVFASALTISPVSNAMTPMSSPNGSPTGKSGRYSVASVGVEVSQVEVPQAKFYQEGETLSFRVVFTDEVMVAGTPSLPLVIGSTVVDADYASGSGSNTLLFAYTIANGLRDLDGISVGASLEMNGGSITDSSNIQPVSPLLRNVGNTANVMVNSLQPKVTSVDVPVSGIYKAGDNLTFTVTYDMSVLVTGSPRLVLTVGSDTKHAPYVSGSGSRTLIFTYTVQEGDLDADGITLNAEITPNGGTIQDQLSVPANMTLYNAANTSGVIVDTTPPAVPLLDPIPFIQNKNELSISGMAEANSSITLIVDNTPVQSVKANGVGEWSMTATVADGTHQIKVRSTDMAGNISGDSITITVFVDGAEPAKPAITLSEAGWTKQDVVVTIAGEINARIEYNLNNGSWQDYTAPFTVSQEGITEIRARQTDNGQQVSDIALTEIRIDKTKPLITLNGAASIYIYKGEAFQDPGAAVTDVVPGLTANVMGSVDVTVLGTYTLEYDAVDPAGNTADTVTRTVRVVNRPVTPTPPVVYPVTGISLDEERLTLTLGAEPVTLKATISPAYATNQEVRWTSNNPDVAEVDQYGKVTPKRAGEAVITVTSVDGNKQATSEITVKKKEGNSISLETSEKTFWLRSAVTQRFKVYSTQDGKRLDITNDRETSYQSDNKLITVMPGRVIAGKKEGEAVVTVSYRGEELELPVIISKLSVRSLQANIQQAVLEVEEEQKLQLTAEFSDKSKKDVTPLARWSVSNLRVADVTEDGVLTAKTPGTAYITGKFANKSVTFRVLIVEQKEVKELEANRTSLRLENGKSRSVSVKAVYEKGFKEDVTSRAEWASMDPQIVTVENGVIITLTEGSTFVTATYNGHDIKIQVEVRP